MAGMSCSRCIRALRVIFFAGWAGLVAGSVNALWILGQWLEGAAVFADRHYLWMAPVATMFLFAGLSFPVAVVAAIRRAGIKEGLWTWIVATGACAAGLLPMRFLHPMAALVLAAGLGALVVRVMAREHGTRRIMVGGLLLFALPALIAALVVNLPSAHRSRDRMPAEGRPNVLLLILDTVRADALSIFGSANPTSPRMDSLAREGVLFQWAMAPSSWSLPSHSSFFTGARPGELSARWTRRLDGEKPTLAEVLHNAGWRTGGFVGNYLYGSWGSGIARGFETYRASPITLRQLRLSLTFAQLPLVRRLWAARSGRQVVGALRAGMGFPFEPVRDRYHGADIIRAFQEWRREDLSRPYFAFLNLFEAHESDMVPERWTRRFRGGKTPRDRYDGIVAWEDSVVGALLDTLAVEGGLDRTLIIVSSDHGEMFGSHGVVSHGSSLYLGVQRVPLIVRFPAGAAGGTTVSAPVTLQDVPSTVVDVLGLPASFPGRSWRMLLADSTTAMPVLGEVEHGPQLSRGTPANLGPLRSLTDERWRCILHSDGRLEVYDYRNDLEELHDLAATPSGREIAENCRAAFARSPTGYRVITNPGG